MLTCVLGLEVSIGIYHHAPRVFRASPVLLNTGRCATIRERLASPATTFPLHSLWTQSRERRERRVYQYTPRGPIVMQLISSVPFPATKQPSRGLLIAMNRQEFRIRAPQRCLALLSGIHLHDEGKPSISNTQNCLGDLYYIISISSRKDSSFPVPCEQVTWSRLCREGGRPSVGEHVSRAIRNASSSAVRGPTSSPLCPLASAQQRSRRPLTWEDQYPRSRYRGYFQPPIYEDEPSDSSQDEGEDDDAASLKR